MAAVLQLFDCFGRGQPHQLVVGFDSCRGSNKLCLKKHAALFKVLAMLGRKHQLNCSADLARHRNHQSTFFFGLANGSSGGGFARINPPPGRNTPWGVITVAIFLSASRSTA